MIFTLADDHFIVYVEVQQKASIGPMVYEKKMLKDLDNNDWRQKSAYTISSPFSLWSRWAKIEA